jgi:muramidase (phage lysozyme)
MTKEHKALLDTIAYTEGTLGNSQNGYDVVVGSKRIIAGWTKDTTIVHGGSAWHDDATNSNAAGRYQFMYNTWLGSKKVNLPMTKDNQDKRGVELLDMRLKGIDLTQLTTRAVWDKAVNKLAPEWASWPMASDVTTTSKSGKVTIHKAGSSYYDSDGVNKARHTVVELWDIYKLALSKY